MLQGILSSLALPHSLYLSGWLIAFSFQENSRPSWEQPGPRVWRGDLWLPAEHPQPRGPPAPRPPDHRVRWGLREAWRPRGLPRVPRLRVITGLEAQPLPRPGLCGLCGDSILSLSLASLPARWKPSEQSQGPACQLPAGPRCPAQQVAQGGSGEAAECDDLDGDEQEPPEPHVQEVRGQQRKQLQQEALHGSPREQPKICQQKVSPLCLGWPAEIFLKQNHSRLKRTAFAPKFVQLLQNYKTKIKPKVWSDHQVETKQ